MARSVALALVAWALPLAPAPVAALDVPYLSGRVVDDADLLPPDTEAALTHQLEALENETGAQVVVLTLPSLEGEVLEDYAVRVAETWGLGNEERDNGVLMLVSRDDRQLRIEVGYGLEGVLPDLATSRIIRNVIVPSFKAGDYPGGIQAGVDAIAGAIRKEPGAVPEDPEGRATDFVGIGFLGLVFLFVVGSFSLGAAAAKGCQGWFLYLFLTPFYFIFPTAALGPRVGAGVVAGWLILFPILRYFLQHTAAGKRFQLGTPGSGATGTRRGGFWGGGFGGGGGFSGGGGGGFSGGGGSFGGGGASGSW